MPRAIVLVLLSVSSATAATSAWVHPDAQGRLAYQTLPGGDRIMDFSHAGYAGGGVALPTGVPVKETVSPQGADDTAAIQAALDRVAALPLVDGFRGAVQLTPGEFHCSATLSLRAGGVVLRGAGAGTNGTTLKLIGRPHAALAIGPASREAARAAGPPVAVLSEYVPAGARTLEVRDAAGFAVGDVVLVNHPVTPEWVSFMGMDHLVRSGKAQTWIGAGGELHEERVIAAIA